MILLVLLLFCSCLGCLREGVWTKYTPADVARWQAQAELEPAAAHRPASMQKPVGAGSSPDYFGLAKSAVLHPETTATPVKQFSGRAA